MIFFNHGMLLLGSKHFLINIYKLKRYYAHAYIRELPAGTKEAKASSSFENVASYFCDHFFSPPSYLAILELKSGIKK